MLERFLVYPHWSSDDHVFMAGSAAQLKNLDEEARAALWDKLPKGMAPGDVTALRLFDLDDKQKKLPKILKQLDHLEYLSVPAGLVSQLTADALPKSLRTLVIETSETATTPEDLVLPQVERVLAPGVLFFGEGTFPKLTYLQVRLDPKKKLLALIPKLRSLRVLDLGPISDPAVFAPLAGLAIEFLNVAGGNLASLDGLEKLPALTALRLHSLNKLTDLSPLAKLPKLKELSLLYCPNLAKVDALLQIKHLEALEMLDCKDKSGAIKAIRPALEKRGMKELTIP